MNTGNPEQTIPLSIIAIAVALILMYLAASYLGRSPEDEGFVSFTQRLGGTVAKPVKKYGSTPLGMVATVSIAAIALLMFDIVRLSTELTMVIVAVLVFVGAYLGLKRVGRFNWLAYGIISVGTILLVLEGMNPGSISDALGSGIQGAIPLLIMGIVTVWYIYRKSERTIINIGGEEQ